MKAFSNDPERFYRPIRLPILSDPRMASSYRPTEAVPVAPVEGRSGR